MPERMTDRMKRGKRPRLSSEGSDSSSISSSSTSSSSSLDDETDSKDLKPIKEYMDNRKELAAQLFKSVKADKIQMMLPQILKKVEFDDLEELCANELIGMSKTRMMHILNGQEMLQSSDTDESIDSGPSLEIISDTDLLSDEEPKVKVEGSNSKSIKNNKKSKKKIQDQKNSASKSKSKLKDKNKSVTDGKSKVKVKLEKVKTEAKDKEKESEKAKEKEGESLLDLLELEMRARAIRALIRKEETPKSDDAQTQNPTNKASGSGILNDTAKARQANLKEQLEKIDVLMKHGEDEDVFVVIHPAPMIELLSSDSDTENQSKKPKSDNKTDSQKEKPNEDGGKQISTDNNIEKNKDNLNQIDGEKCNINNKEVSNKMEINEANLNKENYSSDRKCEVDHKIVNQRDNLSTVNCVVEENVNSEDKSKSENLKEAELEEGEIVDNDDDEQEKTKVSKDSPSPKKIKKSKKDNCSDDSRTSRSKPQKNVESRFEIKGKSKLQGKLSFSLDEPIEIEESPERRVSPEKIIAPNTDIQSENSKTDLFDEKSLDIEEIINLDDYSDDSDDLERNMNLSKTKDPISKETGKTNTVPLGPETWATRYIQQDEVQNVIKESKIQSEIRKRLREKQKQSKLNNSPKDKEQSISEPEVLKPIGSVEEYLALKGLSSDTSNDASNSRESNSLSIEKKNLQSTEALKENESVVQFKENLKTDVPDEKTEATAVNESENLEKISILVTSEKTVVESESCPKDGTLDHRENKNLNKEKDLCKLGIKNVNVVSPKSDSSEDNIIVKIDNIYPSDNIQNIQKQVEQTLSNESKTSDS